MKQKRSILFIALTFLFLIVLSSFVAVQAAEGSKTLNIKMLRNSGYGYALANSRKNVWKIYDTTKDRGETIYCLKGGPGFGSTDLFSGSPQETTYTRYYNLKDTANIPDTYKTALPDVNSNTYKQLLWVLDHSYIAPKINASTTTIQQAEDFKTILLKAATDYAVAHNNDNINVYADLEYGYEFTLLTDDDIDATQQLAIWYFTNPSGDYHVESFDFWLNAVAGTDANYKSLTDFGVQGWDRAYACQALFDYLVNTAKSEGATYSGTASTQSISFASTTVDIQDSGSRVIVGPYKLQTSSDLDYTLTATVTDGDNNTVSDVILLDGNRNEVASGTTIKDLVGQNFYISLPMSVNTSKITLSVRGTYFTTTATYWSVANPTASDQPVVILDRTAQTFSAQKEATPTVTPPPVTKVFDLALRKYITKLNGTTITDTRTPVIDETTLGTGTTATYQHRKDPVVVKNGDFVTYNITVYNEGEKEGRVIEIIDQLPKGLEFSKINTEGFSAEYDTTNNKVTITRDASNTTNLAAYVEGNLKSETIEIECQVTATPSVTETVLTNVAWISKEYDAVDDKTIITTVGQDRDSEPGVAPNVNKDNMSDYTGNENKEDLTDTTYYYKGQQDDDDFEKLILEAKPFDLSLRKFITTVSHNGTTQSYDRAPVADVTPLKNGTETTAIYNHSKTPISVDIGDEVIYTIRVYNEGEIDGYVTEIADHLPEQLEFLKDDEFNKQYGWIVSEDGRTVKTDITSPNTTNNINRDAIYANRTTVADKVLLKAYDGGDALDYIDVQIKCKVKNNIDTAKKITNIADITGFTDYHGNAVLDRDSQANNVTLPTDETLPTYRDTEIARGDQYIPGQQDDDDFEKLLLKEFDLSLRKFITEVEHNGTAKIYNRAPVVDVTPLKNGTSTTATYTHSKTPVSVDLEDEVIYTIRVYNEGEVDGYVTEITDHLPEQLEFIVNDELNAKYGWKVSSDGRTVTTDITSPSTASSANRDMIYKNRTTLADKVLLKAYDGGDTLDYIDVQIKCKVKQDSNLYEKITNIADITGFTDANGNTVKDRDSEKANVTLPKDTDLPKYKDTEIERGDKYIPGQQDDDDFEKLILQRFDLALRKFITGVNDKEIINRAPVFTKISNTEYKYEHTKEPVEVANGNTVIYTLRIFNEGNMAGYAQTVKDNLPEGIEFLPEHEINKEYRWVMYKEDGTETTDVAEASYIQTDYLSKEQESITRKNLINPYNPATMTMPDYKDVKIAFKVTEPNTSDRIIINTAEIAEDADEKGQLVEDIDSTPNNNKEGEDDIDIEKIKVKYFDLSLRKWVTESIVTYDGQTTVTKTGNKAEDDPETPAKVEIRGSRVDKTTVKFKFNIRVTNEGEIEGYATELKDYIPEGLKFVASDNPEWQTTEEEDVVVTDQLKDTLLQPGESATVSIILTWINDKNNMGEKVNWAEISKDYNEYNSPDIDSTPNNRQEGEDDIDYAPVILTTVTGNAPTYIGVAFASLSILTVGVILIKKFVI